MEAANAIEAQTRADFDTAANNAQTIKSAANAQPTPAKAWAAFLGTLPTTLALKKVHEDRRKTLGG